MGKMLDKLNEYLENATQEELQETYNKLSHLLCKDNSTIVERAESKWEVEEDYNGKVMRGWVVDAYIQGATEQEQITKKEMMDKAHSAFDKSCGWLAVYPWYEAVLNEFKKAMEE